MNARIQRLSRNQGSSARRSFWPVSLSVLVAWLFVQPPAQADPPTFLESEMQLLQQVFLKDSVPATGFISVHAANARLNSQVQMEAGGGTASIGDSGATPLRMELNKVYPFVMDHGRFYSGQLRFQFPACANSYTIVIDSDDGLTHWEFDQSVDTTSILGSQLPLTGTIVPGTA